MKNLSSILILVETTVILLLLWRLGLHKSRSALHKGDIVIFNDTEPTGFKNLLTTVLEAFPGHSTVQIRFPGTTATVDKRCLRRLELAPNYPLLHIPTACPKTEIFEVPDRPFGTPQKRELLIGETLPKGWLITNWDNTAGFEKIPLCNFAYGLMLDGKRRLTTSIPRATV
ncbi:MAG: hypothetical protein V4467_04080 [Patescibacteria group bacterium]